MKVLILGSTGMLGHVLSDYLTKLNKYNIYNLSRSTSNQKKLFICDVKDQKNLKKIINEISPQIVINCIGILNDDANKNPKEANFINSILPNFLIEISMNLKFKLIHISTDCVFSGETGNYNEYSVKDAKDIYGKTKSKGEFDVNGHLTLRTSFIGPDLNKNGKGLFQWIMQQNGKIQGFSNVVWTGVTSLELSKAIDYAIDNKIDGVWNLTNGKPISKYDLLKRIVIEFELVNISVEKFSQYKSDKSLTSVRNISYEVPNYNLMLKDLKEYYNLNKNLYI